MARIERVWKTFSLLCEFSAFTFLVMFNINEVVDPSLPSSIRLTGVKLLRLMGWRGGRQIGPKHVAAASGKETAVDNFVFHCLLANVVFLRFIMFLIVGLQNPTSRCTERSQKSDDVPCPK
jgi:hypothetical protein